MSASNCRASNRSHILNLCEVTEIHRETTHQRQTSDVGGMAILLVVELLQDLCNVHDVTQLG